MVLLVTFVPYLLLLVMLHMSTAKQLQMEASELNFEHCISPD